MLYPGCFHHVGLPVDDLSLAVPNLPFRHSSKLLVYIFSFLEISSDSFLNTTT